MGGKRGLRAFARFQGRFLLGPSSARLHTRGAGGGVSAAAGEEEGVRRGTQEKSLQTASSSSSSSFVLRGRGRSLRGKLLLTRQLSLFFRPTPSGRGGICMCAVCGEGLAKVQQKHSPPPRLLLSPRVRSRWEGGTVGEKKCQTRADADVATRATVFFCPVSYILSPDVPLYSTAHTMQRDTQRKKKTLPNPFTPKGSQELDRGGGGLRRRKGEREKDRRPLFSQTLSSSVPFPCTLGECLSHAKPYSRLQKLSSLPLRRDRSPLDPPPFAGDRRLRPRATGKNSFFTPTTSTSNPAHARTLLLPQLQQQPQRRPRRRRLRRRGLAALGAPPPPPVRRRQTSLPTRRSLQQRRRPF